MAKELQAGDVIRVTGYDIVAAIRYLNWGGEALVLCNNSTHFLVVVRKVETDDDAEFVQSFSYVDDDEDGEGSLKAHASALKLACVIAQNDKE